jgi:hypothetical protein
VSYFYEPRDPSNPDGPRYNESPTSADTGALGYDQLHFNLDFSGRVNWNLGAGPLNVATGAEWRREGYMIEAGDPVSYQYGRTNNPAIRILNQNGDVAAIGTQGFPGYSPREALDEHRRNVALYVDFESLLAAKFLAGAAARYEHYSDFGSTVTGKVSGRYNFNDRFSLRSTVSTGFRAPGVQQEFYNSRSTNLNKTRIKDRKSSSGILPAAVLFDQAQVTLVEEGQPRHHHILGATYRREGREANVRFNYFGAVSGEGFTPGFKQTWGGKWLTDASFIMPLRKDRVSLTVGGLNVFDVYPDRWDPANAFPFPQRGFIYGWETLPFGINGGYYYARVNLRLPR